MQHARNKRCLICCEQATGNHYGVITCGGCNYFFRRSVQKQLHSKYICKYKGACLKSADFWALRKCKRCRLDKCYECGMKAELVGNQEAKLVSSTPKKRHRSEGFVEPDFKTPSPCPNAKFELRTMPTIKRETPEQREKRLSCPKHQYYDIPVLRNRSVDPVLVPGTDVPISPPILAKGLKPKPQFDRVISKARESFMKRKIKIDSSSHHLQMKFVEVVQKYLKEVSKNNSDTKLVLEPLVKECQTHQEKLKYFVVVMISMMQSMVNFFLDLDEVRLIDKTCPELKPRLLRRHW